MKAFFPPAVERSLSYPNWRRGGRTSQRRFESSKSRLSSTHSHDAENDGQGDETHKLNGLSSPGVDEQEGSPVSACEKKRREEVSFESRLLLFPRLLRSLHSPRDETSSRENQVSDTDIVEFLVGVLSDRVSSDGSSSESDGGENDGRVESETVESDIKREPRPGTTEELDKGEKRCVSWVGTERREGGG